MDQLSNLLRRFKFSARVFHSGELCGSVRYGVEHDVGYLHLLRQGSVRIHHADRPAIPIRVPTLLFYPRAVDHRLVTSPDSPIDILCATIAFQRGAHNLLAALPDLLQVPLNKPSGLDPTLSLLFEEAFCDRSGKQLVLDRLCDILVVQLLRHAIETNLAAQGLLAGLADTKLSAALAAIHDEPSYPWNVEQLARLAGMSRSGFARRFHDVVGAAPADYLTGWRITLAQSLLEKGKPVKAVAFDVGYHSQPAFTKAFTARVGVSPRAWLDKVRNA